MSEAEMYRISAQIWRERGRAILDARDRQYYFEAADQAEAAADNIEEREREKVGDQADV